MDRDPEVPAASPPENQRLSPTGTEDPFAFPVNQDEEVADQEKTAGKRDKEVEEEEREGKRRKVSALDKCPPPATVYNGAVGAASFSFETKIEPVYSTPKFGSFNYSPESTAADDNGGGVREAEEEEEEIVDGIIGFESGFVGEAVGVNSMVGINDCCEMNGGEGSKEEEEGER